MRKLLLVVIAVFTATLAHAEPIVDVLKIAGKSENEYQSTLVLLYHAKRINMAINANMIKAKRASYL